MWRDLLVERAEDLISDEKDLQRTLRRYQAFSNVAVVCGIVVPILAGSTVLTSIRGIVGWWPIASGAFMLVASVLIAVHKGLNCDAFHAKCRAALAQLRVLAMDYERVLNGPTHDGSAAVFDALELRLAAFYKDFMDVLPMRPTRLIAAAPGEAPG